LRTNVISITHEPDPSLPLGQKLTALAQLIQTSL